MTSWLSIRHGLVSLAILGAARVAHPQEIVVSVVEAGSGAPIAGAEVIVPAVRRSVLTGTDGEARLLGLTKGITHLRVRHVGHVPAEVDIILGAHVVSVLFVLPARVVTLDTVRVTGARASLSVPLGFSQRRELGIGRFLDNTDLASEGDRDFVAVISARIPGLRRATTGSKECLISARARTERDGALRGAGDEMQERCGRHACVVRVLLDDTDVTEDLWLVKTWDVAAVEYYTVASTPVQYGGGKSQCGGLLLLWSKR